MLALKFLRLPRIGEGEPHAVRQDGEAGLRLAHVPDQVDMRAGAERIALQQQVVGHRLAVQPGEDVPGEGDRLHIGVFAAQTGVQARRTEIRGQPLAEADRDAGLDIVAHVADRDGQRRQGVDLQGTGLRDRQPPGAAAEQLDGGGVGDLVAPAFDRVLTDQVVEAVLQLLAARTGTGQAETEHQHAARSVGIAEQGEIAEENAGIGSVVRIRHAELGARRGVDLLRERERDALLPVTPERVAEGCQECGNLGGGRRPSQTQPVDVVAVTQVGGRDGGVFVLQGPDAGGVGRRSSLHGSDPEQQSEAAQAHDVVSHSRASPPKTLLAPRIPHEFVTCL